MKTKQELIQDFFKKQHLVVIGLSQKKPGPANAVYDKLEAEGFRVTGISRSLKEYHGKTCFTSLSEIPTKPDAVFIATNPKQTLNFTQECINLGISLIWMHDMSGTSPKKRNSFSSVSKEAVELARASSLEVIDGNCPMQQLKPDLFHTCLCKFNSLTGRNN
jgi:predicted CoA-binding protein